MPTTTTTQDTPKETAAQRRAREKAEKAQAERERKAAQAKAKKEREVAEKAAKERQAKIDVGELVVHDGKDYVVDSRVVKSATQIAAIVDTIRNADGPVVFNDTVEKAGAKYPEDMVIALHALAHLGMVKRLKVENKAAYIWTGDKA